MEFILPNVQAYVSQSTFKYILFKYSMQRSSDFELNVLIFGQSGKQNAVVVQFGNIPLKNRFYSVQNQMNAAWNI